MPYDFCTLCVLSRIWVKQKFAPAGILSNQGTPQFWKIFYSCLNPVSCNDDFNTVKKASPFKERISNKFNLLQDLKSEGIWLLDASILGLHIPGKDKIPQKLIDKVIGACWDIHISTVIEEANPERIIVIGKGVWAYFI